MRKSIFFFSIICFYMIVTPAFQCGDPYNDVCPTYTQDTAKISFNVNNNNHQFRVLDTIQFSSFISDTIQTVKGNSFISPLNTLSCNMQAYKVVDNGSGPILNYANIEFNPLVIEGQFQNYPNQGISLLYNRIEPLNRLRGSLVAGTKGLYLITVGANNSYYSFYIYESNNPCTQYKGLSYIPEAQQQRQYWDSLGTSVLRLSGANDQVISNKSDGNYFFIKVVQ